jgi:holo-[acyl-carrier protein] synthase
VSFTVGTDLCAIDDVEESMRRFGEKYLRRVYTPSEIAECERRAEPGPAFAGRFAAKEAVFKSLHSEDPIADWKTIEVESTPGGWCEVRLTGAMQRLARRRNVSHVSLSISHEREYAHAIAIATISTGPQTP